MMKCPLTFGNPACDADSECDINCAWAVIDSTNDYTCAPHERAVIRCAMAVLAAGTDRMVSALNHQEEEDL